MAGLECYKAAIDYAPGNSDVRHKAISAYSYKAQEYELFKRPTEELARIALYEARNSRQTDEYAARWAGLLRIESTHDPLTTAYDLLRDAHKSPDDDLVSRTGAQVFGEIVKRLAMSPDPEGPTLAIRLADKAQEWLDWTFSCHNDWGRAKKAGSELSKQIVEIREIAEPIVELNKLHEAEKALHLRQAELGAQIAAKIRPAVAKIAEAPIAVAADAPPVPAPAAGRLLQMELPKVVIPTSPIAPGIGIAS